MRRPSSRSSRALAAFVVLAALAVLFALFAPDVLAQHSGGSFGGSHFGGGGGGGYHGGGGGGFGGYHGGGGLGRGGVIYFGHGNGGGMSALVFFGIFLIFGIVRVMEAQRFRNHLPGPEARAWMSIDVTAVRIAVDGTARAFIQAELDKLSRGSNASRAGLLRSLKQVVHVMRKCDAAWIYGGATNFRPMSAPVGEAAFRKLANDARSKFEHELVRNADGKLVERASPGFKPREHEGEGVALVTIVVAAKREILDFHGGSRESILAVLSDLDQLTPDQLIALEVAWSPADPNDRISTATLEAIHPDLLKLPGALGGRMNCSYCKGPFAAELPTCPHCGAPSGKRAPS